MQEARKNTRREMREDLIDSLIAMSLLTQRMARTLIGLTHENAETTSKGENNHGKDERTGNPAYRVVRA